MQNFTVDFVENFHFLRPYWLILLVPVLALAWWYFHQRQGGKQSGWQQHVDSHLLAHLMVGQTGENTRKKSLRWWCYAALTALVVGIAGPTWEKRNVPAFSGNTPTLLVLSLAQSMNADDIQPTRLKRAVHKIRDILAKTEGDARGLVIYSDRPFTAAPLTTDHRVIEQMLPELSTNLMPVLGNRLDLALEQASNLLKRGGANQGNIIVLTDGMGNAPEKTLAAATQARQAGYRVAVLGIGTEEGAALTVADGRKVSDANGHIVQTALDVPALQKLAQAGGGKFHTLTASDSDIDDLVASDPRRLDSASEKALAKAETWIDYGFWLLLLPALLMPFAFRRGVLVSVAISVLTLSMGGFVPRPAYAQTANAPTSQHVPEQPAGIASWWQDLWLTPNQQAQQAFANKDYQQAAKRFENPDWKASADYRAGDLQSAIDGYRQQKQEYNLGNALAKSGDLQGALAAYDRHLATHPDDEDAQFNRDIVKQLLDQQKQDQQKQDQQKQDQQKQDQQKQDQQKQDQQKQDQQKQSKINKSKISKSKINKSKISKSKTSKSRISKSRISKSRVSVP